MKIKRLLSLTVALVLVFSMCTGNLVWAEKPVVVTVDGHVVNFDVEPRLIGGRTMVPLRAIFEALGATVEWNEETQTVTAYNEAYIIKCAINSHTMYINNEARTIDVAPMIVDSRTLVPARFVAEAFNCNIDWDDKTFTVTITCHPIDYSKVEQGSSNASVSTTTVPDTMYESTNNRCYPGTSIPDYTYVTGIEQKSSPFYADNGWILYIYRNTKTGEFSEVIDYMKYLRDNGWSLFDEEEDSTSLSWFYVKDKCFIGITYNAERDEITVGAEGY